MMLADQDPLYLENHEGMPVGNAPVGQSDQTSASSTAVSAAILSGSSKLRKQQVKQVAEIQTM